jgi:hypothetical protein
VTTPLPDTAALRALAERAIAADGQDWYSAGFLAGELPLSKPDADFIAALTPAAVLALLSDRDRLDWLDQYGYDVRPEVAVDPAWNSEGFHDETDGWANGERWFPTLREAIDASRATPSERGQADASR